MSSRRTGHKESRLRHRYPYGDLKAPDGRGIERSRPAGEAARPLPARGRYARSTERPLYQKALRQLAAVRLDITRVRPKFKLGQNRPPEARQAIVAELRKRGRPTDARTADALEWTLREPVEANGRKR